ncbi:F-box domain-containing protein [Favolaschia claudopus]|uniref:F-box domain-containing protein n=1 Tax=Favolaschia claudopus TaxID=2862362 RepID=A0AAV9ZCC1_9AGAR
MLDTLPVELVLYILRGSSLSVVLSVSRTCSYLRGISLVERRLWVDASDAYRIRLPLGETLKTMKLSLIPGYAARCVAIRNKVRPFQRCTSSTSIPDPVLVSPIRTYETTGLYKLPAYAPWGPAKYSKYSFVGHIPPTFLSVLPGGHSFLLGSLRHLAVYDLVGEYGIELNVGPSCSQYEPRPGTEAVSAVDWDSRDHGVHIGVAVLSKAFDEQCEVQSYLSVFQINYDVKEKHNTNEAPSVRRTQLVSVPFRAEAVAIRGSLVVVHNHSNLLLVDLRTSRRGWWHIEKCMIQRVTIDVGFRLPAVFLAVRSQDQSTLLFFPDVTAAMLECSRSESRRGIASRPLEPHTVYTLPNRVYISAHLDRYLTCECITHEFSEVPVTFHNGSSPPGPGTNGTKFSVLYDSQQPVQARSSFHTLLTAVDPNGLMEVQILDSDEDIEPHARSISFPAERMHGVGRSVAFDPVYGIGLVFARGRVWVTQY